MTNYIISLRNIFLALFYRISSSLWISDEGSRFITPRVVLKLENMSALFLYEL